MCLVALVLWLCVGCVTAPGPEVIYGTEEDREIWTQGIAAWRQAHPQFAGYVIWVGLGGPSRTELEASQQAKRDAYERFGATTSGSELDLLEVKTVQKVMGQRYFWYSYVYVGFDRRREDLRAILINHLVSFQKTQRELSQRRKVLTGLGWPAFAIGASSTVAAIVSYVLGTAAWAKYDNAQTSSDASYYREKTEMWSVLFVSTAAGAVALPLGSTMLLVRPNPAEVEQQIESIREQLALPVSEVSP